MLQILVSLSAILSTSVLCQDIPNIEHYRRLTELNTYCNTITDLIVSGVTPGCHNQLKEVCGNEGLLFKRKFCLHLQLYRLEMMI